ncbi:MAG: hypothetical protein CMO34_03475 [Verrucomicrobia bacterium]|nr:hypothetical protein [Verrucomicrobiota bacterium]
MLKNSMHSGVIFLLAIVFLACQDQKNQADNEVLFSSKNEFKQSMIASHQNYLQKEKAKIDAYIDSLGVLFQKSGTGLRTYIYDTDSLKVRRAKRGDIAVVQYQLSLLDGEEIYATEEGEFQEFLVDFDDVERGLHEGIKQLKVGDKAIFILPAHMAHGITGDQIQIPPQATIVYDVHLIAIR